MRHHKPSQIGFSAPDKLGFACMRAHSNNTRACHLHHKHELLAPTATLLCATTICSKESPISYLARRGSRRSSDGHGGVEILIVVCSVADGSMTCRTQEMVPFSHPGLMAEAVSVRLERHVHARAKRWPSGAYTAAKQLDVAIQGPYVCTYVSEARKMQECTTNAFRASQCSSSSVLLRTKSDCLELESSHTTYLEYA